VQTPLTGPGAAELAVGDLVWFRHAKSGELFEHTRSAYLLQGAKLVDEVPTYRGLGRAF
jgi:D-serine deaminase-like pyridoxal phosphate-dependent protein